MGAGKTAIGRELARELGLDFIDVDQELERRTGVDIPLIFEKEGEAGFRRREHELIEELTLCEGLVLATGGGAVLDPANRECLKQRGFVIYLEASIAAQTSRTGHNRNRPMLDASPDRAARLTELFSQREPLYQGLARLTVNTDSGHVRQITRLILKALEQQRTTPG